MKKGNGVRAWLVTWEWAGEHAAVDNPIVDILDPRCSVKRVKELVEFLYETHESLSDRIAWRLLKQSKPYPADVHMRYHGAGQSVEIVCGHNPWLRARLVENLVVAQDEYGQEVPNWTDRSFPKPAA